jgi:hypothetical protein
MPNYQNGKIYKIYSPIHPEVPPYYGSTVQLLHKRFLEHKYRKKGTSNLIICYEDALIELVEEVKCNNVEELLAREVWWITNNPCINKRNPIRPEGAEKKYKAELYIKQKEKLNLEWVVKKSLAALIVSVVPMLVATLSQNWNSLSFA